MEDKLYEKIGKQEMMLEAIKRQSTELSMLVAKFISGEEKPSNWSISPQGQLMRKPDQVADTVKPTKK